MPTWGSLASKLGGKKKNEDEPAKPKRGDDVIITIYQKPNQVSKKKVDKIVLATGDGSWLSHLNFNGKTVWTIEDEVPQWIEERKDGKLRDGSRVLPSDMMNRTDIPFMIERNWEEAEKAKVEMEQQQRDDRKLREAAEKRRKAME